MSRLLIVCLAIAALCLAGCEQTPSEPEVEEATYGNLQVNSDPRGASIKIDGTSTWETTPEYFADLETGQHTIALSKLGYSDWAGQVEIVENETATVNAVLDSNPARLTISSVPNGAAIALDYQDTGEVTPHTFSLMGPDTYLIELQLTGYFEWSTDYSADPGDTAEINAELIAVPDVVLVYDSGDSLWRNTMDNANRQLLADNNSTSSRSRLQCSPDKTMVAYYSGDNTNSLVDSYGTPLALIEYSNGRVDDYSWSNDSQHLVNGSYFDGIYRYDLSSGEKTKIRSSPRRTYDHNPVYSPDDSQVAFVHHRFGCDAYIILMDSDGNNQQAITSAIGTPYDQHLFLSWISADALIFRVSSKGIYLVQADGSSCEKVIDCRPDLLRVSADQSKYAYADGSDLYVGEIGNWSPNLLISGLGSIRQVDWSTDAQNLAVRTYNGVYWVTADGQAYHLPDTSGSGGVGILAN